MSIPQESLMEWTRQIKSYRIPRYDELPSIELYMDQVVVIIEETLRIFMRDAKDRRITPAMINNYVKLKSLPPPVKKRYNRTHLCHLVIICMLKQVLAISEIRDLIQSQLENGDIATVYDDFCTMQERSFSAMLDSAAAPAETPSQSFSDRTLRVAVHASVNKMIAEKMIDIQNPEPETREKRKEKD
jgi:hypothetical protein